MLKRVEYGKQQEASAPIQSLVKLQPWFLSLQWKTCLQQKCSLGSCACSEGPTLGQKTLMIYIYIYIGNFMNLDKLTDVSNALICHVTLDYL